MSASRSVQLPSLPEATGTEVVSNPEHRRTVTVVPAELHGLMAPDTNQKGPNTRYLRVRQAASH
jgi:hypothetical protein